MDLVVEQVTSLLAWPPSTHAILHPTQRPLTSHAGRLRDMNLDKYVPLGRVQAEPKPHDAHTVRDHEDTPGMWQDASTCCQARGPRMKGMSSNLVRPSQLYPSTSWGVGQWLLWGTAREPLPPYKAQGPENCPPPHPCQAVRRNHCAGPTDGRATSPRTKGPSFSGHWPLSPLPGAVSAPPSWHAQGLPIALFRFLCFCLLEEK